MKIAFVVLAIVSLVHCRYRRWGYMRTPPPPSFLKDVNETGRQEYYYIVTNMSLTIAEQKNEIQTWAAQYNVTSLLNEFTTNEANRLNEARKNISDLIGKLPTVLGMRNSIKDNDALTLIQKDEALANLSAQYPQEFSTIEYIKKLVVPCGCGGPGKPKWPRGPRPGRWDESWQFGGFGPFRGYGDYGRYQGMNQNGPLRGARWIYDDPYGMNQYRPWGGRGWNYYDNKDMDEMGDGYDAETMDYVK